MEITNNKWFDKLTTLSLVEGQITMTEIQNSKRSHHLKKREFQYMFGSLSTCPVECRLLAALVRRIPQGENLKFICNLVLEI